jgi:membrane protein implicated in regulation of membrane protease activity
MALLLLISAFSTFIAIAVFGFVFVVASAILGDFFDHDIGHDVDHGDGGHGGPSILSGRILSVFVTAFGGFGAIGSYLGYGTGLSTAMAFGGGIVFAAVIFFFAKFLYGQQASSHVHIGDLVGCTATVSVAIPENGLGQIQCTLGDSTVEKIARSKDGHAIPANSLVKVEEIVGDTVLVKRAD